MSADVREVLRAADELRKRADALETIRLGIRLGRKPLRLRDRIFAPASNGGVAVELTQAETRELYAWCSQKIAENEAEATRLEATVEVKP